MNLSLVLKAHWRWQDIITWCILSSSDAERDNMQPGELLARLEACLDSLERDPASKGDSQADGGEKQCCVLVLLQQTADLAYTSDFIRQVSQCRESCFCLLVPRKSHATAEYLLLPFPRAHPREVIAG